MRIELPIQQRAHDDDKQQAAAAPTVCRLLRTKQTHGTLSSILTPWQAGRNGTASFWCLATMESFGPDDGFAHAQKCRAGRVCFKKPE